MWFNSGIESHALIAYLILFNHDKESESSGIFETCNQTVQSVLDDCMKQQQLSFSLNDFSSTLVKMAIFASYNIDWEEEVKTPGLSQQVTGKGLFIKFREFLELLPLS